MTGKNAVLVVLKRCCEVLKYAEILKKKGLESLLSPCFIWRPQGDSNPCYRRERASLFLLNQCVTASRCCIRAALLLAALTAPAHAADLVPAPSQPEWTLGRTTALTVSTALLVADWGQTRTIATQPDHPEMNPLLGRDPHPRAVDLYFASAIALNLLAQHALPAGYRELFAGMISAMEAAAVINNHFAGIEMHWQF